MVDMPSNQTKLELKVKTDKKFVYLKVQNLQNKLQY